MTGSEVQRIRKRLRLTQAQFARRVGVHRVTVVRWEGGILGIRESATRLIRLLAKMGLKRKPERGGR